MDASPVFNNNREFDLLVVQLNELTKYYSLLLELIKKEKDLLIEAKIDELAESNKTKEALLAKIRATDLEREKCAYELGLRLGLAGHFPRLLELAKKATLKEAETLRTIHTTLTTLIERVTDLNQENQLYTESALKTLSIALGDIKNTLGGKKTYARKGKMEDGPNRAGNFVSKEA